jgi:hypothetical protein
MRSWILGLVAAGAGCACAHAQPVGTAFTYQGQVTTSGSPASGTYDVQYMLFDAAAGGTQIGATNCYDGLVISNGLLTSTLDFGNAFAAGATRWLQIGIRADSTPGNCGSGVYTVLSPRQELTGAPSAIGLGLPFSGAVNSTSDLLTLTNSGTGTAITGAGAGAHVISGFASAAGGVGVYGMNTLSGSYAGLGYGTWGIYGQSTTAYGIVGATYAPSSAGIYGFNGSTTGAGNGGLFTTISTSGTALSASAEATSGATVGVYGVNLSTTGIGVQGVGDTTSGANFGVYGLSNSPAGIGVFGYNEAGSDQAIGVYGKTESPSGYAVYGVANSPSGGYAIYGSSSGAPGYAGYFVGRGYFSDFVGLGTTNPSVPLQVAGGSDLTLSGGGNIIIGQVGAANVVMDNNEVQARNNGAAAALFINANGGNVAIGANNAQGDQLWVQGTAGKTGGGSWASTSDARVKKNIRPLTGALDTLLRLRGVTFEYIDPASLGELPGVHTGMVAQEVEKVEPGWVESGADGIKRISFHGFEALTVEALRELRRESNAAAKASQARVAALEQENKELRGELADLKAAVDALAARSGPK